MKRIGPWLRSAREAKGVSLEDAAAATRIRWQFLAALEEGDFANLPQRYYLKGFLRIYSDYLDLDEHEALRLLENELGPEEDYQIQSVTKGFRARTVSPGPLFAAAIFVVCLIALSYYAFSGYSNSVKNSSVAGLSVAAADFPIEVPGTPTPSPNPTATFTPAPTATPTPLQQITVEVRITERCWLRVLVDDNKVFEGILEAGQTMSWTADDKISLRAGNAGGVEIFFNGKRQGTMGSHGEVIERVWTKP